MSSWINSTSTMDCAKFNQALDIIWRRGGQFHDDTYLQHFITSFGAFLDCGQNESLIEEMLTSALRFLQRCYNSMANEGAPLDIGLSDPPVDVILFGLGLTGVLLKQPSATSAILDLLGLDQTLVRLFQRADGLVESEDRDCRLLESILDLLDNLFKTALSCKVESCLPDHVIEYLAVPEVQLSDNLLRTVKQIAVHPGLFTYHVRQSALKTWARFLLVLQYCVDRQKELDRNNQPDRLCSAYLKLQDALAKFLPQTDREDDALDEMRREDSKEAPLLQPKLIIQTLLKDAEALGDVPSLHQSVEQLILKILKSVNFGHSTICDQLVRLSERSFDFESYVYLLFIRQKKLPTEAQDLEYLCQQHLVEKAAQRNRTPFDGKAKHFQGLLLQACINNIQELSWCRRIVKEKMTFWEQSLNSKKVIDPTMMAFFKKYHLAARFQVTESNMKEVSSTNEILEANASIIRLAITWIERDLELCAFSDRNTTRDILSMLQFVTTLVKSHKKDLASEASHSNLLDVDALASDSQNQRTVEEASVLGTPIQSSDNALSGCKKLTEALHHLCLQLLEILKRMLSIPLTLKIAACDLISALFTYTSSSILLSNVPLKELRTSNDHQNLFCEHLASLVSSLCLASCKAAGAAETWQLKDSALECLSTIICKLSTEDLLPHIATEQCQQVVNVLSNCSQDAESYVRVAALRTHSCLLEAICLRGLSATSSSFLVSSLNADDNPWKPINRLKDLVSTVEAALKEDTEAVVRRQAVKSVVIGCKAFHLMDKDFVEVEHVFKQIDELLLFALEKDLDWEVKVNTAAYWGQLLELVAGCSIKDPSLAPKEPEYQTLVKLEQRHFFTALILGLSDYEASVRHAYRRAVLDPFLRIFKSFKSDLSHDGQHRPISKEEEVEQSSRVKSRHSNRFSEASLHSGHDEEYNQLQEEAIDYILEDGECSDERMVRKLLKTSGRDSSHNTCHGLNHMIGKHEVKHVTGACKKASWDDLQRFLATDAILVNASLSSEDGPSEGRRIGSHRDAEANLTAALDDLLQSSKDVGMIDLIDCY